MLTRIAVCIAWLLCSVSPAFAQCTTSVEGGNVVTHWSNAIGQFLFGAVDQVPFAASANYTSPMYHWGPPSCRSIRTTLPTGTRT